MLIIFLVFCVVFFGEVCIAHLFSFLCCVFGEVRVDHLLSFLCCVFGGVCVDHLFSFLSCVFGRVCVDHLFSFLCCVVYFVIVLFVSVLCLVYPMLPVYLDCPFLIDSSVSLTFIE